MTFAEAARMRSLGHGAASGLSPALGHGAGGFVWKHPAPILLIDLLYLYFI